MSPVRAGVGDDRPCQIAPRLAQEDPVHQPVHEPVGVHALHAHRVDGLAGHRRGRLAHDLTEVHPVQHGLQVDPVEHRVEVDPVQDLVQVDPFEDGVDEIGRGAADRRVHGLHRAGLSFCPPGAPGPQACAA